MVYSTARRKVGKKENNERIINEKKMSAYSVRSDPIILSSLSSTVPEREDVVE